MPSTRRGLYHLAQLAAIPQRSQEGEDALDDDWPAVKQHLTPLFLAFLHLETLNAGMYTPWQMVPDGV